MHERKAAENNKKKNKKTKIKDEEEEKNTSDRGRVKETSMNSARLVVATYVIYAVVQSRNSRPLFLEEPRSFSTTVRWSIEKRQWQLFH